ncbi:MAG: hypothetical protein AMS18_03805 [Gemmatimonas sp. SG8_17]|nr:MAG: hypothetical protein AMS18_03805 [Gemmatimonas sp. SG8_17]
MAGGGDCDGNTGCRGSGPRAGHIGECCSRCRGRDRHVASGRGLFSGDPGGRSGRRYVSHRVTRTLVGVDEGISGKGALSGCGALGSPVTSDNCIQWVGVPVSRS